DVDADASLGGLAAAELVLSVLVLLAEDLDGFLHVAAGLDQGGLALHHLHAGAIAQFHYVGGIGFHLTTPVAETRNPSPQRHSIQSKPDAPARENPPRWRVG